jgi:hypothetical protein
MHTKMRFEAVVVIALLRSISAHAEPASPSPQPAPTNAITQAAAQKGVLSCAARLNQVSTFLGFGPQAGALVMVPPAQPDQRIVPLIMELPTPSGSAYASASFAPNQANGCGATYDAVVYWPDKCEAVAAKSFPNMKNIGKLKKNIGVLDGGQATKVFLMPAGVGCISIKKEVVL